MRSYVEFLSFEEAISVDKKAHLTRSSQVSVAIICDILVNLGYPRIHQPTWNVFSHWSRHDYSFFLLQNLLFEERWNYSLSALMTAKPMYLWRNKKLTFSLFYYFSTWLLIFPSFLTFYFCLPMSANSWVPNWICSLVKKMESWRSHCGCRHFASTPDCAESSVVV